MKAEEHIWRTKDGRSMDVRGMDDMHVYNTLRYLRTRLAKKRYEGMEVMVRRYDAGSAEGFCRIWIRIFEEELQFREQQDELEFKSTEESQVDIS